MHIVVEHTSLLDTQLHCSGHSHYNAIGKSSTTVFSRLINNKPKVTMPSKVERRRPTQSYEGNTCIQSTINCTHTRPTSNTDSHSRPPTHLDVDISPVLFSIIRWWRSISSCKGMFKKRISLSSSTLGLVTSFS